MPASKLGLYDLLAPQFLVGFNFPTQADQYLSILAVDELHTAYDANAVVYTGLASFTGDGGAVPVLQHQDDSGAVFQWDDVTIGFRLLVPREGSPFIQQAVQAVGNIPNNPPGAALNTLLNQLGNPQQPPQGPTDYPGIRFRLDLLFSALTFHLHKSWQPAMVGPDFRVIPDPAHAGEGVKFVLPKAVFTYEQGANLNAPPTFQIDSWGNSGFDAPADLAEGELVRMDPPLAIYENNRVAFGVDQVLLDLSRNSTPPEILAFFGTDEAFRGIYIKSARFYYADKDKSFALNFSVDDVLISFAGEVSLEARVDILGKQVDFGGSVQIYDGADQVFFNAGTPADPNQPLLLTKGNATMPGTGVIQVTCGGGIPPYSVSMKFTEKNGPTTELFDNNQRQGHFNPAPAQDKHGSLVVTVEDSSSPKKTFSETLDLTVLAAKGAQPNGGPLDRPPDPGERFKASLLVNQADLAGLPSDYGIQFTPSEAGNDEVLLITGGNKLPSVSIAGGPPQALSAARLTRLTVPPGSDASPIPIVVTYPAGDQFNDTFNLLFNYDEPFPASDLDSYASDSPHPADVTYQSKNPVPSQNGVQPPGAQGLQGTAALRFWIQNCLTNAPLTLDARASYEGHPDTEAHNQALSDRRLAVAKKAIGNAPFTPPGQSTGETLAKADYNNGANPSALARDSDHVTIIKGTPKAAEPAHTIHASISRKAGSPPPLPKKQDSPPAPQPQIPEPAPVFRRLSIRVRLERNIPVLVEVSGELDFETDVEQKLRTQPNSVPNGNLGLQQRQGGGAQANPGQNPEDGVVDFLVNVTYDTSTHFLTETLALGAGSGDRDGLLQMKSDGKDKFKNIFGALLTFTPIINAVAGALNPNSAGDWAELAVSLAVPVAIGGFEVFQTKTVTLFGAELKLRQAIPPGGQAQFTDSAIVFDYGVSFGIALDALNIKTTKDLMVRYKAVGFNLHFGNPVAYQPIFDTSKGYEIDLSDPGLFNLPAPLGDILKLSAARIANFNPLTLELDIAIKADLGVVTVDKFKIKMPLHPNVGPPMILPSGVKINIPAAVKGEGFVEILDNGFAGGLDITIIPVKVRVAATLAVESVTQGQRKATAVYASLVVEFPAPIILGSTGLGIYGFAGLFAMHFRRTEDPPVPNDPVGPALRWLQKAEGQPTKFKNSQNQDLWVTELDRWSFGIGAVLGTVDGGFLVNLRGMVIVELPGPRILITVKMVMIFPLPQLGDANLTVGLLGVMDLDFNLGQLTLGVLVDLSIKSIVSIRIPVELFFSWADPSNWHLYLGTTTVPVSADVLGIVKAYGYFMIDGKEIKPFPPGTADSLPGIAVALGIKASIILGDESIGLYLKVSAGADLGVSFSPKLFVTGDVFLDGELRLFIVSIGASGKINVIAPDPTYLHCHICGSIDLFFFSISACVDFDIGTKPVDLTAPELVLGCWLQSFSPVITSGQGSDKPIDASLGDARVVGSNGPLPAPVPIDTVPVLQLHASPDITGVTTFTEPLKKAPGFTDPNGWVNGDAGKRVRYSLTDVSIQPPVPAANGLPPAVWRKDAVESKNTVTDIDLALFSRTPVTAARAFERSTELKNQVDFAWGDLCKPVAPPVCVLFTFCKQPLGPSGTGWDVFGVPMPDPPGTVRDFPPPGDMIVNEPPTTPQSKALDQRCAAAGLPFLLPARVVGHGAAVIGADQRQCIRALQLPDMIKQDRRKPVPLSDKEMLALRALGNRQWIILRTGAFARTRLWLALSRRMYDSMLVVVDELDGKDNVIATTPINSLHPVNISVTTGLPPEWLDPQKPWLAEVSQIASILNAPEYQALMTLMVTIKPHAETTSLRIRVTADSSEQPPTVLLGAAEVCSRAEQDRYDNALQIQKGQIETLTGYMDGGQPVPLLAPATHYTVSVTYQSVVENAGATDTKSHTRTFEFDTDSNAPAKLGSYVLGSSPAHEEKYHFWNDPTDAVEILFNDLSILQLFGAYGKKLRLDLRAADGLPEPKDGIDQLTPVVGDISGPFYDTVKAMIDAGQLPCVGGVSWNYGKKTLNAQLRPLMAYTLDVVTDPPDAVDPNKAVTPLYRVQFSTSKYATIDDLINDVAGNKIKHRALTAQINLPTGGIAPDQAIEDALTAAGEQTLPAASQPGITVYWAKRPAQTSFSPHAILIDAPEPVWRTRTEHQPVQVDPSDPTFVRIENVPIVSLEMNEQGTANVARFVHSPGGTRTIVFLRDTFNPPAQGGPTTLVLHRPKSKYFDITDVTKNLITVTLAPTAPWEDDHE